MKRRRLFSFAIVIICCAFIGTDPFGDKIKQALDTFYNRYPQEKVYLQLDKDYYASGEDIWFKGYVTIQNRPTFLSGNLYVELLDSAGNLIKRDMLPIVHGGAPGNFSLPQDFHSGEYRIRAYTAWMLNFDPGYLFYKNIHVFNPKDTVGLSAKISSANNSVTTATSSKIKYAVQFFPEGGDLITGLQSEVAFKAIDDHGMPIAVQGRISDNNGNDIATIQSVHDGMGKFSITPEAGKQYKAVFLQTNGSVQTFALPQAKPEGIVLHVLNKQNSSRIFFMLSRSKTDATRYNHVKLVAQMQDELIYMADINFNESLTAGMIPTQNLPPGIMQITVLDSTGIPLGERLSFVKNNNDSLPLQLVPQKIDLEPRAKNTFQLIAPDALKGNFSVAVTDADQVTPKPYDDNIISNLLLTSDIKGYVHNPAWYFKDDSLKTLQALDLVMMTNGWRRFQWEKIMDGKYPTVKFPVENGITLKGQIFEQYGNASLSNGTINLIIKAPADTMTYYVSAPVNALGEFTVGGLNFHDVADIFFQGTNAKNKDQSTEVKFSGSFTDNMNHVNIERPLPSNIITSSDQLLHFLTVSNRRNRVDKMLYSRNILLQEVTITGTKKTPEQTLEDRYTSGLFKGGDAYTFDLTKEALAYTDIFQYLQGKVAGLQISGSPGNYSLSWRGGAPSLYLDEMPVDVQTISTIAVTDVALIKVFRPPFMGGFGGSNGAIAIYTKKGGDNTSVRGLGKMQKAGYTLVKQFYSPDYAVSKPENDLPDNRVTLYWNPEIKPDSISHTATISFYNNDFTERYRVVIEGLDSTGRIGRIEKIFQ